MSLYPIPPAGMDGSQLLDEAEHSGDPAAIEVARRYLELEPVEWFLDVAPNYDLPTDEAGIRDWLDDAVERKQAAVGDREHLLALLCLLDTEGAEAVAAYVGDTVRNWVF